MLALDDGYDATGIAVSWKAPNFVGGAPVESYELRYRQASRFVGGSLIEHLVGVLAPRPRCHRHDSSPGS